MYIIFIKKAKKLWDRHNKIDIQNKLEREQIREKATKLEKFCHKFGDNTFKNKVMKECIEEFYDERFKEKINQNKMIFPFKNGIYDLKLNIFREAKPEDFISKTCGCEYNYNFNEDSKEVKNVKIFFEKIFPDRDVRNYFMDICSDLFKGGNFMKQGYFWTGHGNNGKSVTQNLIELMLGKLSIKLSTTILTGKKPNNGAANPEMARTAPPVRLVTVEEPNESETINNGTYKNMTGNDKYYARDLFEKGKDGREIDPMYKLVIICNKLPKFKFNDEATWIRTRVIPFESTFVRPEEPCAEEYEEQLDKKRFPMDLKIKEKLPLMINAFAWLLLKHRIKNLNKTRYEPDKVREATNLYKRIMTHIDNLLKNM